MQSNIVAPSQVRELKHHRLLHYLAVVLVAPSQVRELKRCKGEFYLHTLPSHLHRCVN